MSQDDLLQPLEFIPPSLEELSALLPAYQFDGLLAKGCMETVYKATQTSLDRPVAIKVLPPELGQSESFRESFIKKAKRMARLNHPNLINVFDFGEIEGMLYIVMEFVDGTTLYEKTHDEHLEQKEALEIIIAICRALSNAHEAGILHRDIKPTNIFITTNGTPKIGNFGLARPSGDTETGIIFGTPGYTAPEVIDSPDSVGPATDVYSVGIMLYELLVGKVPEANYQPIATFTQCDPLVEQLIRKAIAPQLPQRFQTAEAFAAPLEEVLRKLKGASNTSAVQLQTAAVQSKAPTLVADAAAKPIQKPLPPKKVSADGGNGFTKFLIIVALLVGIYYALEFKKQREADVAAIEKKNADEAKRIKDENKKRIAANAKNRPASKLSVFETLEQLKPALLNGERPREKFPRGTVSLMSGKRYVLFINKKMTWHEATQWAAQYGAQLATISSDNDFRSLRHIIPKGETAWVGAATSGKKQWAWADGTAWTDMPGLHPTSKLAFAQVDSNLFASPKSISDKAKFLIEWKGDGSTPASLTETMKRAANSSTAAAPSYPAGTLSYGPRNYYLCPTPLTLTEAKKLAEAAGANLATPSKKAEIDFLSKLATNCISPEALCRIGGSLNGSEWQWLSREAWTGARWDDSCSHENDSLALTAKGTWKDVASSDTLAYTLFEWSSDAKPLNLNQKLPTPKFDRTFNNIQEKAAKHLAKAASEKEEKYAANIQSLKDSVQKYYEELPKKQQMRVAYSIQEIESEISEATQLKEGIVGLGDCDKLKKLTTDAFSKQEKIDQEFEQAMEKVRGIYLNLLTQMIKELEAKGQILAANKTKKALEKAKSKDHSF